MDYKKNLNIKFGNTISNEMINNIVRIEKNVFTSEYRFFNSDTKTLDNVSRILHIDSNNIFLIYGTNWYLLGGIYDGDEAIFPHIEVFSLAKIKSNDAKIAISQYKELMAGLRYLLDYSSKYNLLISASLKESTSYILYLSALKHNLIEPFGIEYKCFSKGIFMGKIIPGYSIVTRKMRNEYINNIKRIREEQNDCFHRLYFKSLSKN